MSRIRAAVSSVLLLAAFGAASCDDDRDLGGGAPVKDAGAEADADAAEPGPDGHARPEAGGGKDAGRDASEAGGDSGDGGPGCVVDDLFCNGIERMVGGKCVVVAADPCDDGESCTQDSCDEVTDTCEHVASGSCAVCAGACVPVCDGKECGENGCGGSCGKCADGQGCASVLGKCQAADGLGTCGSPRPLTVSVGVQTLVGDTTSSLHQVVPTCNDTSTAVEDVYSFTLASELGVEIESYGYDTVLHLRKTCLDDSVAATLACSDDSAPPGDYGSRISAKLGPGTYFLIVDGFDSTQFGPYTLQIKAAAGCVPHCDGVYCGGDDGCGGDCGSCGAGEKCGPDFRCRPDPCVPDCGGGDGSAPRVCGDDGCLGSCGTCPSGELCVRSTGTCAAFPECDHDAPVCDPPCGQGEFCGVDCQCRDVTAALPDLVVNPERLKDEILFDQVTVNANSCSVVEGCVGGLGDRRVLRFSVEAINQGQADLVVPPPADRPDEFQYSSCHGHYHFSGFAEYRLLDGSGKTVLTGTKQAYCMEDTTQVMEGPGIACTKRYNCDDQGIQAGWSDLYGNALDCQWLDITEVAPGDYELAVTVNPQRSFEELSFENNTARVKVTIPAP